MIFHCFFNWIYLNVQGFSIWQHFLYFFVVAFLQDLILNIVNDQIFFSIMRFRFFFRQIFTCFFVTWFVSGSFFHMIILGRSFSCLQLDLFLGCLRHAPLLSYLPWLGNFFVALFWGPSIDCILYLCQSIAYAVHLIAHINHFFALTVLEYLVILIFVFDIVSCFE